MEDYPDIVQLVFEDNAARRIAPLLAHVQTSADIDRLLQEFDDVETDQNYDLIDDDVGEVLTPRLFLQIVEEARDLLRHGLRDEAIDRLSKLTSPKWDSKDACRAAYVRHMKAQRAAQASPPGATS
ncbi:MAG: hypothetical protein DI549_00645 [Ancylobacter novellus]|uniref:Uncharacterized protein n=1 Tax=Ancylobacter novellus TaxID=921 RepID=A0A2W5T3U0_ANCNO|nr:MAG: hypothetical protein DI549_00645 [Ancylobacter novellus]